MRLPSRPGSARAIDILHLHVLRDEIPVTFVLKFVEISLGDRCSEASGVAKPRSSPSLLAVLWAILLPVLYTNLKSFSGA